MCVWEGWGGCLLMMREGGFSEVHFGGTAWCSLGWGPALVLEASKSSPCVFIRLQDQICSSVILA